MKDIKTILFYILAGVGLIAATTLFQVEDASEITSNLVESTILTPTTSPTATIPRPTRVVIEAGPQGCITTPYGGREGHQPNAPFTTELTPPGVEGDRMIVSGTVYASDCETPLPGVLIEVWHADPDGQYYTASASRGRVITDSKGRYKFTTIKPSPYMGIVKYIPAHIHFQVSYPNTPTLATQLFFEDDRFLLMHNISSAQRRLTRPITTKTGSDAPILHTTFDLVLTTPPPRITPNTKTWYVTAGNHLY